MIDFNIIKFKTIDSTNKYVVNNLSYLKHADVVVADTQTAGRGRLSRLWDSQDYTNIYATITLKQFNGDDCAYLKNITQFLSVIVSNVIDDYGLCSQIKWPNDIKVNDKKICGILSSLVTEGSKVKGMALGFGLNVGMAKVNLDKISQPATSIAYECGIDIDKNIVLDKILKSFFEQYDDFLSHGFSLISEKYHEKNICLNKTVTISLSTIDISGKVLAFDSDGTLILQTPLGAVTKITTGDLLC